MHAHDVRAIGLLLTLYAAEGLPYGLVLGSIPFLLKERASFGAVALFSLCAAPYALKLLVAPVVDGWKPPLPLGRRAAWLVPAMAGAGTIFIATGGNFDAWVADGRAGTLTAVCIIIIALVALSEVALDGWSVEVLSEEARPYAALCQVLGPSIGYTSSFTIFLALNDASLCNMLLWPALGLEPRGAMMSLNFAACFTGFVYLGVTLLVAIAVGANAVRDDTAKGLRDSTETDPLLPSDNNSGNPGNSSNSDIREAYRTLFVVLKLRPVQQLVAVLLLCKLGFSTFDAAAPLKLVDLGFPKESIASIALVQSLCQLLGSIVITPIVARGRPDVIFVVGYFGRLVLSFLGPPAVYWYASTRAVTPGYFTSLVVLEAVYGVFGYCLMYVPAAALFLHVTSSTLQIAASYLTLLHAAYNVGTMWPKPLTLSLVDWLTWGGGGKDVSIDGYYVVSLLEGLVGVLVGAYIWRMMPRLGKLDLDSWAADGLIHTEESVS